MIVVHTYVKHAGAYSEACRRNSIANAAHICAHQLHMCIDVYVHTYIHCSSVRYTVMQADTEIRRRGFGLDRRTRPSALQTHKWRCIIATHTCTGTALCAHVYVYAYVYSCAAAADGYVTKRADIRGSVVLSV